MGGEGGNENMRLFRKLSVLFCPKNSFTNLKNRWTGCFGELDDTKLGHNTGLA